MSNTIRRAKNSPKNHIDKVNDLSTSMLFNWNYRHMTVTHIENLVNTVGSREFITCAKLVLSDFETKNKLKTERKIK